MYTRLLFTIIVSIFSINGTSFAADCSNYPYSRGMNVSAVEGSEIPKIISTSITSPSSVDVNDVNDAYDEAEFAANARIAAYLKKLVSSEKIINDQGWRESEWLGYFLPTPSGWNFHSKLGWFWSLPVDDENIWLFVNGLEWLWLTRTNFPFVYFYKEKNWFYIDVEMSNPSSWLIYDFNSGSWTAIEFIPPSL